MLLTLYIEIETLVSEYSRAGVWGNTSLQPLSNGLHDPSKELGSKRMGPVLGRRESITKWANLRPMLSPTVALSNLRLVSMA